jgi:hypothetical protein
VFLFQGVAIPQSQIPQLLQPLSIPQPQTPQQEPVQEIQSVVVAPPSRARTPQVETPEEGSQEASIIPPTRVITAPTQEAEIPSIEIAEQRIEEPKVLTTPSESVATPIQEEIGQPPILTTPTISVVPSQEEEPVEQPRITTTPSISVTPPQEEIEQQQEQAPQPARPVQVSQAEELAVEEPQVLTTTPAQQPIQLNLPESVITPPLPETTAIKQLPSEPISIPEVPESPAVVPQATIPTVDDGLRPAPPQKTEDVTTQERPQSTSRLEAEDFGTAQRDTPQRESRLNAEDFGTAQRDTPPRESRLEAEDFGTGGSENFLKPATSSLTKSETPEQREEVSGEPSRAERDPDFDRESEIRQRGETPREFKERQEQLREERAEVAKLEAEKRDFIKRAREGDIIESPSGIVPVEFTRADGNRKILAFLATEFIATTEGAVAGERTTSLPDEQSYFIGGGGGGVTSHPFKIASRQDPDNENQYLVTVNAGTINSLLPSGIFSGPALQVYSLSSNTLRYVNLTASSDGQQITTASVSVESSAPSAQTPEIFGLPSSAKFLLGLVYNSNVFQVQFTNLVVTGKQQFIASKSSPAAVGELPYEIYYVWG